MTLAFSVAALAAATVAGGPALAKDYFLASGRWDNVVLVIDLEKAIDPKNDATPNAVINRLRVTPDIEVEARPFRRAASRSSSPSRPTRSAPTSRSTPAPRRLKRPRPSSTAGPAW
ncbi:hypothetical protein [Chenggangzhangella methanolivorans]|uniref:CHASE2 domain-containing protein n=1 Tax=Chenggangzhangella methanolivorans TaxID=1437009 RepID=A0A9E6R674_9HYPH|nr:hypothetical protein [Chenggangzhangella methanolivorans]QZN98957.1 hypothetical protein K6K41_18925 [Chenggangzhangella methanolivorans]